MTILTLQAHHSPGGQHDFYGRREADARYPVLVVFWRLERVDGDVDARTGISRLDGPRVVGQHIMTEADASMLKAGVDLWQRIPMLTERLRLEWEGWTPPATEFPIGKLGPVLKLLGVAVAPAAAPNLPVPGGP